MLQRSTLLLLFCILLSACAKPLTPAEQGSRDGVLHYSNGSKPITADPQQVVGSPSNRLVLALYEGLTNIDPNTLIPEPGVAERWDISDDGLVYTFYLRKDALWSDKKPITTQDFLWSWQRLLSPTDKKRYAPMFYIIENAQNYAEGKISDFSQVGIQANNAHTLTITLRNPAPYFLYLLSNAGTMPLPQHIVETHGEADALFTGWTDLSNLVTNGPFVLSDYNPESGISLTKSSTYWDRDHVSLNGMYFYFIGKTETAERLFNEGKLHFTQNVPLEKLDYYQNLPNSPYRQTMYLATYFYLINSQKPPLDDVRVRRALSLTIDRAAINKELHSESMQPTYSFTPPGLQDYFPREFTTFNPTAARTLLAEAGYPNGENWPSHLELSFNSIEIHQKTAQAIADTWKKELNIVVTPKALSWKEYMLSLDNKDYDITRLTWIGDYPEPKTFLELFLSYTDSNPTHFASKRFDELILEAAPKAESILERNAIYTEAETILMEFAPLIPLFTHTSKHLIHPDVRNMPPNILDFTNFKYVSLAPPAKN